MSIVLGSLTLPAGLKWVDEMAWSPVRQTVVRRLDGGTVVFSGANLGGRPITLEADESYWLTRDDVDALQLLAAIASSSLTLSIRGQTHQVMFRHQDDPAIDLSPMVDYDTPDGTDSFIGKIKLMTV